MLRAPPSPACVALPLLQPQALFARDMSVAYPLVPWRCPVLPVHAPASHIPCLPAGPVQVLWHPAPVHEFHTYGTSWQEGAGGMTAPPMCCVAVVQFESQCHRCSTL